MRVTSVLPVSGPTRGGTRITFLGANLGLLSNESSVLCDFGGTPTHADIAVHSLSTASVSCTSPTVETDGPMTLSLRSSGATIPGEVSFLYYTEPSLQSLYPALGPIMGGSLVTVSGIGFPSTLAHSVTCKFGASEPTLAQRVAASAYACTTPLTQSIHLSTMRLSFNGQDFTPIGIIYEYVQPTIINQVDPACGPVNGGTGIQITGGPFPQRSSELSLFTCRFDGASVAASRHDENTLKCVTPPSATGHGYVSLGVSISGPHGEHHGSPGSLFRYEEPIILTTFSPTQGPMAGGTALTMSAGACGQLFCRFSSGGGEHAFTRGIPGYAPEHNVVVRGPGPLLVPASRLSSRPCRVLDAYTGHTRLCFGTFGDGRSCDRGPDNSTAI